MTDAVAHFLMAAALLVTLGYCAFTHESECPGCPRAVASEMPSVAFIQIPQLRPEE